MLGEGVACVTCMVYAATSTSYRLLKAGSTDAMLTATRMNGGVLMTCLRWIKKRKITILLFVFSFIVSGLIINLLQLFTMPMYWINKKYFRNVNSRLVYFHWCSKFVI